MQYFCCGLKILYYQHIVSYLTKTHSFVSFYFTAFRVRSIPNMHNILEMHFVSTGKHCLLFDHFRFFPILFFWHWTYASLHLTDRYAMTKMNMSTKNAEIDSPLPSKLCAAISYWSELSNFPNLISNTNTTEINNNNDEMNAEIAN